MLEILTSSIAQFFSVADILDLLNNTTTCLVFMHDDNLNLLYCNNNFKNEIIIKPDEAINNYNLTSIISKKKINYYHQQCLTAIQLQQKTKVHKLIYNNKYQQLRTISGNIYPLNNLAAPEKTILAVFYYQTN